MDIVERDENLKGFLNLVSEKISEQNGVYLLESSPGLYAMFEDNDEHQYIPVWTDQMSCMNAADDEWEGYESFFMNKSEFLSWLEELQSDEIFLGLFLDNEGPIPVEPKMIKRNLAK